MTTIVMEIDDLIGMLEKQKEKGKKYAVIAPDPVGGWRSPTAKKKYYTASFAIADVFEKSDLRNLMNATGFAVFLYDESDQFSEEFRNAFEGAEKAPSDSSQEVRA